MNIFLYITYASNNKEAFSNCPCLARSVAQACFTGTHARIHLAFRDVRCKLIWDRDWRRTGKLLVAHCTSIVFGPPMSVHWMPVKYFP